MPSFKDMYIDEIGDLHINQIFCAPKSVDDEKFCFFSQVEIPTGHAVQLHITDGKAAHATLTNEQGKSIRIRIDACKNNDFIFQHRKKSLTFQIFREPDGEKAKQRLISELPKYIKSRNNIDYMECAYFVGHLYQLSVDKGLLPDIRNPELDTNLLQLMRKAKPKYQNDFTGFWEAYVQKENRRQATKSQKLSSTSLIR